MKRSICLLGLLVTATLLLTNCQKEAELTATEGTNKEVVKEGIPFSLIASTPETKTANDGLNTVWQNNDAVSVFHSPAGGSGYVNEGEFTIVTADLPTNTFRGTISDAPTSGNHDWFMFYPYHANLVTPVNDSERYFTVGHPYNGSETQNGNNSMAHLAGTSFPLYGKAESVSYDAVPSISLNHACAYLEFNVTNNSTEPLIVEQITFKATEDIIGTYYIDFHDLSNVVFTSSGATYTKPTAVLNVEDGVSIAIGSSAKFYMGIKPFTAPKDSELEVTINGYKKTIAITKEGGVSFSAGKIKKLNINYNYEYQYFAHTTSITEDDVVILTSGLTGNVSVMKHYDSGALSGNAYDYTTLAVSGGIITATPDVAVLTVGDGGSSKYTFYDPSIDAFVDATSQTSSNYMKTAKPAGDNSKFTVTFTDSGDEIGGAVITNSAKKSRNVIRYNSRFACYNSGTQSPVYLFKKVKRPVSLEITTDPTKTDYKCGETIDLTGMVVTATYSDASSEDVAASVTTNASDVLAHVGTGKTVTVSYMGLTDTFTVNVSKGDANISFPEAGYTVAPSASFTAPTLNNPHGLNIVYSASNSLVTVNSTTGAVTIGSTTGTVTINATTSGNDDFNGDTASYTITIKSTRTYTYTFSTKEWGSSETVSSGTTPGITWSGSGNGNSLNATQGVQILGSYDEITVSSSSSFTNVSSIVVTYSTNASKGAGTIKMKVGSGTEQTFTVTKPSSGGTTLKTHTYTFSPNETGTVALKVDATENSVYIKSIAITAE